METIKMDKEYKRGDLVLIVFDGRTIPAEYVQRRGKNHEVLVSPRHIIPTQKIDEPDYETE
jgi:hypothetical protein